MSTISPGFRVRIALGSNLGDPPEAVAHGWAAVCSTLSLQAARLSRVIASDPAEGATGGTFANAVGVGYTSLDAHDCLAALLGIERAFGRDRAREGYHGARPLDLDLLDWNGAVMHTPTLHLPHPRSHGRLFVLAPWAELEPNWACAVCGVEVARLTRLCRDGAPLTCLAADAAEAQR